VLNPEFNTTQAILEIFLACAGVCVERSIPIVDHPILELS
jgi:hypothetical protein